MPDRRRGNRSCCLAGGRTAGSGKASETRQDSERAGTWKPGKRETRERHERHAEASSETRGARHVRPSHTNPPPLWPFWPFWNLPQPPAAAAASSRKPAELFFCMSTRQQAGREAWRSARGRRPEDLGVQSPRGRLSATNEGVTWLPGFQCWRSVSSHIPRRLAGMDWPGLAWLAWWLVSSTLY